MQEPKVSGNRSSEEKTITFLLAGFAALRNHLSMNVLKESYDV